MNSQPPAHLTSRRQQKQWQKQQIENASRKDSYVNQSPFRQAERTFKARCITDLSNVISTRGNDLLRQVQLGQDLRATCSLFGNVDDPWRSRSLEAFIIDQVPGLIVIRNPFTPEAQRLLVQKCLAEYAQAPHETNLHRHYHIPEEGIWPRYVFAGDDVIMPKTGPDDSGPGLYDDMSVDQSQPALPASQLMLKQRWVTLGYRFHWATRTYHLEHSYPIPDHIDALVSAIVSAVEGIGGDGWQNQYRAQDFKSEAGVINYYQLRDALMAHVDRTEVNMDAPLVSISLGHSCIYLIGGATKDVAPVPLLLESGDILVMTGPSRMAYHGVPRILENTLPSFLSPEGVYADAPDWKPFGEYMTTSRINVNVRQVFPSDGQRG